MSASVTESIQSTPWNMELQHPIRDSSDVSTSDSNSDIATASDGPISNEADHQVCV